jgi:hypothetical protein
MRDALCVAHYLGSRLQPGGNPFNMNLKEKITDKVGEKVVKNNPFLASDDFLSLMKAVAQLARVILLASSGPAEAMNGIQSMVVTFLKNVPDAVWDRVRQVVEKDLEAAGPASDTFPHLDALRNYGGNAHHKFVEFTDEDLAKPVMPDINAPMPTKPC